MKKSELEKSLEELGKYNSAHSIVTNAASTILPDTLVMGNGSKKGNVKITFEARG